MTRVDEDTGSSAFPFGNYKGINLIYKTVESEVFTTETAKMSGYYRENHCMVRTREGIFRSFFFVNKWRIASVQKE